MNHYEMLGVRADATEEQIKAAYRSCAMKHHPDRNPGDATADDRFKRINAAYEVLGDRQKRAEYDRKLAADLAARARAALAKMRQPKPAPAMGFDELLARTFVDLASAYVRERVSRKARRRRSARWDPYVGRYRDRSGRFSRG